jgi:hypothetical protein
MTLIAITANASPTRGHTVAEVDEMMDLFDSVLEGETTPRTVARMMEILESGKPITATMRAQMKAVRLDGSTAHNDLTKVTADFWRRYRAEHPKPKQAKSSETHVSVSPLSQRRRG